MKATRNEKDFRLQISPLNKRSFGKMDSQRGGRTASVSNACATRLSFAFTRPAATRAFPFRFSNRSTRHRKPSGKTTSCSANESTRPRPVCLGLVGIEADPIRSREHILISNILNQEWSNGRNLDIAGLIQQIQKPSMTKVGVMDLDSFFPAGDRLRARDGAE